MRGIAIAPPRESDVAYLQWEIHVAAHGEDTIAQFAYWWPPVTMSEDGRLHFGDLLTEPVPLETQVLVRLDLKTGTLRWLVAP